MAWSESCKRGSTASALNVASFRRQHRGNLQKTRHKLQIPILSKEFDNLHGRTFGIRRQPEIARASEPTIVDRQSPFSSVCLAASAAKSALFGARGGSCSRRCG